MVKQIYISFNKLQCCFLHPCPMNGHVFRCLFLLVSCTTGLRIQACDRAQYQREINISVHDIWGYKLHEDLLW